MSFKERLRQLRRLADIKRVELNQAAQVVQAAQALFDRENAQLDRLNDYLNEYLRDERLPARDALQPAILAMRGGFIQQLRESVMLQQAAADKAQGRFDAAKRTWLQARKVVDRLEEEVKLCLQAREQALDKLSEAEVQAFLQHRS